MRGYNRAAFRSPVPAVVLSPPRVSVVRTPPAAFVSKLRTTPCALHRVPDAHRTRKLGRFELEGSVGVLFG